MSKSFSFRLFCLLSLLNAIAALTSDIYSLETFDWREPLSDEEEIPRHQNPKHHQHHQHHQHHFKNSDDSEDIQSHHRSKLRKRREEPRRLCGRFLTIKLNQMCKGCTKPLANSNGEVGTGYLGLADICCYKGKCTDSIVKQHCDDDCKNH